MFGDFNEILNSDEKLGWLDRDARQMEGFRECLSKCNLFRSEEHTSELQSP